MLKLNFDYGGNDNNGNVKSQTITTPTVGNLAGFVATQNYAYDSLNRLKSAVETIPNQTGWKQTFKFDRYGNRTFDTTNNNTTTLANGCPINICNPSANPNDNKLVGTNYDSNGNTSQDANGQTFVYDAENKQVQVNNVGGIVGIYAYDGDGKRIKKHVPSTNETTIFVYDAGGDLVAEYSTIVANQAEAKVSYLTNDHLGSPRITTDSIGKVISRRDFMPFGEEIPRAGYGADTIREKFATYERDDETGLDFAQARYYSKNLGRFVSADYYEENTGIVALPFARLENPQTLNGFSYSLNNPLLFNDIDGHKPQIPGSTGYTYRLDRNNTNDSPNIHVFDRRGREIGRLAVKGTVEKPIYEWSGNGRLSVPASVQKNVLNNIVKTKGITPRPPLQDPTGNGAKKSGIKGGMRGVNGVFAALTFADIIVQAALMQKSSEEKGYFQNFVGNIVITNLEQARQSLTEDFGNGTTFSFDNATFVLKNGVFFGIGNCQGCTLNTTSEGKIFVDTTKCDFCNTE